MKSIQTKFILIYIIETINKKTKSTIQKEIVFYKNKKNYHLDMHSHHKQNDITIDNPTPYTDTFTEQTSNNVNISSRWTQTTNNNMTEPHEPTHNPNIFHQIATYTNLKILNPTEYNQIKQK